MYHFNFFSNTELEDLRRQIIIIPPRLSFTVEEMLDYIYATQHTQTPLINVLFIISKAQIVWAFV